MSVEGHLGLWGYSCTSGSLSAVMKKEGKKDLLAGIQFCLRSQGSYHFVSLLAKKQHPLGIGNLTDCAPSQQHLSDVSSLTNTPAWPRRGATRQAVSTATSPHGTRAPHCVKQFWRNRVHWMFFI